MFHEVDLTDAKLEKEFGMGCLRIKGAHLWPLSHFVWDESAKEVSATFFCDELESWDNTSLLRIEIYRLPRAKKEFEEYIEWYNRGRKKRRIKIADGQLFEDDMLHVKGLSGDWERDAFPLSKGEIIRIYQAKKLAIIFRFLAKSGTMLDHPIFKRIVRNVTFDPKQWERSVPQIIDTRPKSRRFSESPLTDDQESEMWQAVGAAMKRLKLSRVKEMGERIGKAELDIEEGRQQLSRSQREERAIELGSLIGQVFCWEFEWEWCNVHGPDGSETVCICSPEREFALDPFAWVLELLSKKRRPLNCLLTFNMIEAERMPPSRPNAYVRIG